MQIICLNHVWDGQNYISQSLLCFDVKLAKAIININKYNFCAINF